MTTSSNNFSKRQIIHQSNDVVYLKEGVRTNSKSKFHNEPMGPIVSIIAKTKEEVIERYLKKH